MIRILSTRVLQVLLGLVCLIAILVIQKEQLPFLSLFNGLIYDRFTMLSLKPQKEFPRVVIIDIDDYSIQQEGRWPWSRDKMGTLLNNLSTLGVKVSALDIVFSEFQQNYAQLLKDRIEHSSFAEKDNSQRLIQSLNEIKPFVDDDQIFASSLSKNNPVLGYLLHNIQGMQRGALPQPLLDQYAKPIDATHYIVPDFLGYSGILPLFLKAAPHAGFVSNLPDPDGVIRHASLLGNYANKMYANIGLATAMRYLSTDRVELITHKSGSQELLDGIKIKDLFIPTDNEGQMLIPFWGLPGTMDYYSASDVIQNKLPPNELAGSIAMIGSSMILLADLHETPVSQTFPGPEINANVITAILTQEALVEFNWNTVYGMILFVLLGGLLILIFPYCSSVMLILTYFFIIAVVGGVSFLLFYYKRLYIDPAGFLLLTTVLAAINIYYDYIFEKRQKNKIKQLFGQYISPEYVKKITDFSKKNIMDEETREMTVFFADIRSFTTLSEPLEAKEIKRLLNAFFTPITDIIFDHKGTIDKYIGDMIMAFWGAPLPDDEHCYNAVATALTIKNSLDEINDTLSELNLPYIRIGMGLATGLMDVGDMGSEFRRSYTVLGDTVNLGSRLQDLTKFYQISILVNESPQMKDTPFIWRFVDKITVKGRYTALNVYEPLCSSEGAPQELVDEIKVYNKGLEFFYAQDWEKAKEVFTQLCVQDPECYLYQLFSNRIEIYSKQPLPKDWDGVFAHTEK